ncbi:MAG: hypothetical protein EBR55_02585 [Chitinophagia bacterium]|jgi:hypothetical protein|nr:hypothetical protein [Chitinophagia bacterium]
MKYILTIGLTLLFFWAILITVSLFNNKRYYNKNVYRQSDMHKMLKIFFNKDLEQQKSFSQFKKRREEKNIKVVVLGNKAYWVSDNVFYVGNAINGVVQPETGKPIDTTEMSKEKLDQMLFILDNLKNGNRNDSGGTRN